MTWGEVFAVGALLFSVGLGVVGVLLLSAVGRNRVPATPDAPRAPAVHAARRRGLVARAAARGRGTGMVAPGAGAATSAAPAAGQQPGPAPRPLAPSPAGAGAVHVFSHAQARAHSYRSSRPPRQQPERSTVPAVDVVAVALLALGLMTLPVSLGYGLRGGLTVLLTMTPSAAAAIGGMYWLHTLHRGRPGKG